MDVQVIALGLATGIAYGASDFLGGLVSRRAGSALAVVALFKLVALVGFAAAVPVVGAAPAPAASVWGAAAGLAIGLGYLAYFRGLAKGHMGMVATHTAVVSAVVPLLAGVALGERPPSLAWAGILAILVAIPFVTYTCSGGSAPADPSAGLIEATAAGAGFGLFFLALARAGDAAPEGGQAWVLLASATAAAVVVGGFAAFRGECWPEAIAQWRAILAVSALYGAGTWAFVAGTGLGWVSVMAVVAALSAVPTMLLARLVLAEEMRPRQYAGVALAMAGVALLALAAV